MKTFKITSEEKAIILERRKAIGLTPAKLFLHAAKAYVSRIQHPGKKKYAELYLKWKLEDEKGEEPDRGSLSVMGAQAVRMVLDEILQT